MQLLSAFPGPSYGVFYPPGRPVRRSPVHPGIRHLHPLDNGATILPAGASFKRHNAMGAIWRRGGHFRTFLARH